MSVDDKVGPREGAYAEVLEEGAGALGDAAGSIGFFELAGIVLEDLGKGV